MPAYICFGNPTAEDLENCCGTGVSIGDTNCILGEDLGTAAQYRVWMEDRRGGASFNPGTFNYLTSQAAQATGWAGGVANTTRWSTAWLMPGYAKFFESESAEEYRMRVQTFKGWASTSTAHSGDDIWKSGWAVGTAKAHSRDTHFGYHFNNIGRNWNNITVTEAGSTNASRGSSDQYVETTSGGTLGLGEGSAGANRSLIFDTATRNDDELAEIMHNGKFMLISRTTFNDVDLSTGGEGRHTQMPWPLCYSGDTTGYGGLGLRDFTITTRKGLGAANPRAVWGTAGVPITTNPSTGVKRYSVLYNPEEIIGLIERFGPYEYLAGYNEARLQGDTDTDTPNVLSEGGDGFVIDRRTHSRLKRWYKYYTLKVSHDFEATAGDPASPMFRKTKALAYKKSDLYALGREVEATTTATTSTSTAPTVAATPSTTGGGTGGY